MYMFSRAVSHNSAPHRHGPQPRSLVFGLRHRGHGPREVCALSPYASTTPNKSTVPLPLNDLIMLGLQRCLARAQWATMQAAAKTKAAVRKPVQAVKRLKLSSAGSFTTGNARLALELTGKLGSSVPFLQGVAETIAKIMEHVDVSLHIPSQIWHVLTVSATRP